MDLTSLTTGGFVVTAESVPGGALPVRLAGAVNIVSTSQATANIDFAVTNNLSIISNADANVNTGHGLTAAATIASSATVKLSASVDTINPNTIREYSATIQVEGRPDNSIQHANRNPVPPSRLLNPNSLDDPRYNSTTIHKEI